MFTIQNFGGWQLRLIDCYPSSHLTLWSRGFTKSRDKLRLLYIHLHSASGHQNLIGWQLTLRSSYLQSHIALEFTSSCKITWQFKKAFISTERVPITIKIGKMMTYLKMFLSLEPFYPLITWSCKIMWQTIYIISPLS